MYTFQDVLAQRTHRMLRATAKNHRLPFDTKQPTNQERLRLHEAIITKQCLKQALERLTEEERSALVALQAANGTLPLATFTEFYGEIRPYRPWLEDAPRYPWKQPISIAEKLWYLAFIEIKRGKNGQTDWVYAPQEVLDLLPPLPRLASLSQLSSLEDERKAAILLVDIAMLLGSLLYADVKPIWGRWLPLSGMRLINQRLSIKDDLTHIHSELQGERIRFLHYLAEVAGLVAVQGGYLKPTVATWEWLSSPPNEQWKALWEAWRRDLASRNPLWNRYRFPEIPLGLWDQLINLLEIGRSFAKQNLILCLRPYLPPSGFEEAVNELLHTVLSWSGLVGINEDWITVNELSFPPSEPVAVRIEKDTLRLVMPPFPPLHSLVNIMAWCHVDEDGWWIDIESVRRAIQGGKDARQLTILLSRLACKPLPTAILEQLQLWEQQVHGLVLRQVAILSSTNAQVLADLRHNRHLRPFFEMSLSAHHVVVRDSDMLKERLERRGWKLVCPKNKPTTTTPGTAAYLWLAVRVYQALGMFMDMPITIPASTADEIAALLPPEQMDSLQQKVGQAIDQLKQVIRGKVAIPSPIQQDDPVGIREAIERAYQNQTAITIDYLSPADGYPIRRTIEPITPISDQDGASYVEAWCHVAGAPRTFRLDRIERVTS